MSEAVYQNIRKLCSGVSLTKPTLRFGTATILSCDVTAVVCLSTDSSFRGHLLHFDTQKYELLTMSIAGGQTLNYQNPSYIAGWPFGLSTMTVEGGQINKYTHPSFVAGQPFTSQMIQISMLNSHVQLQIIAIEPYIADTSCVCHESYIVSLMTARCKKQYIYTQKISDILINSSLKSCGYALIEYNGQSTHVFARPQCVDNNFSMMVSKSNCKTEKGREDLVLQLNKQHLTSNYKLSGGMYSDNADNNNLPWDNLVNKLALIGRLPFDCRSSCGDCFFASMGHGLYNNADLHFHIRNVGITHMINNPELYIESLANVSWDHYIQEMSKQGTWCDNVIIQAVANALSCIIHITDSNPNTINATIITPLNNSQRNQRIVFLGYLIDLHYVSTLQETCNENAINLT